MDSIHSFYGNPVCYMGKITEIMWNKFDLKAHKKKIFILESFIDKILLRTLNNCWGHEI